MTSPSVKRLRRWLLDLLNQCVAIVAWLVDHPGHRIRVKCNASTSFQDAEDIPRASDLMVKPGILELTRKHDWHPVLKTRHDLLLS